MSLAILKYLLVCFIKCKWKFVKKKMYIFEPVMVLISKNAEIKIMQALRFNMHFDNRRILRNVIPGSLFVGNNASLYVDDFTCYPGCRININDDATLSLGTGYMNCNSVIDCFSSITIKNNVKISEGVVIRDDDSHQIIREGYVQSAPIVIENNVWIGLNATILKGVVIGEGCIVAAGAVVVKDCPPFSLVAGVPAKVIRLNVSYK